MSRDEQDQREDEPSLAWFGHPPEAGLVAEPETPVTHEVVPPAQPDVYGRLVMSAFVVGGALLLARSRTFRLVTWRLARFALTTWLPARLAAEVRRAWRDATPAEGVTTDATSSH